MTVQVIGTTVEVLGKTYQLKCAEDQAAALQKAAVYLEEKMTEVRQVTRLLSVDRIAVVAALTVTQQFLLLLEEKQRNIELMKERLKNLENKIDRALVPSGQLELSPAD